MMPDEHADNSWGVPFQSSVVTFFWHKADMAGIMYGKFDSCVEHVLGCSASYPSGLRFD